MAAVGTSQSVLSRPRVENLADILDRILDKGLVIAGDISISLLDIELLTIRIRLLIASADKARELGIDWWQHDPFLSSRASEHQDNRLERENQTLRQQVERLEAQLRDLPPRSQHTARGAKDAER